MQVTLCAVTSLNGYIARPDGSTDWTSKEDLQLFKKLAHDIGVIIIGKKTYDIITRDVSLLDVSLRIVVTHQALPLTPPSNTIFTSAPPKEILAIIKKRGFNSVIVAGGGQINSLFLRENLIDELYLTIEPIILVQGIPLLASAKFFSRLELLDIKQINAHTIRLHYRVIK